MSLWLGETERVNHHKGVRPAGRKELEKIPTNKESAL